MKDFRRDPRFKRPYVLDPDTGKEVTYQRVTTLAGMIDDTYNLQKWGKRLVAKGLSANPHLVEAINAHHDDNKALDELVETAMTLAGASASSIAGTAFHKITDLADAGEDVGQLSERFLAMLDSWTEATAHIHIDAVEQTIVNDAVRAAGTADRIGVIDGQRYILDTKSGRSIDYGIGKILCQLAIYANGESYDVGTNTRSGLDVSTEWGLVIHTPLGQGITELYWVDLVKGWEGVQLATKVRDWQKIKFADVAFKA